MNRKNYTSYSEEETKKIASKIFRELQGGAVIGLKGELGAGKTLFVKGVMESLKYDRTVQSPTFVIRNDYNVKFKSIKKIIHIDLYRIEKVTHDNDEFFEDVGNLETITFIEWPERIVSDYIRQRRTSLGLKNMVHVTIDIRPDDSRLITLS